MAGTMRNMAVWLGLVEDDRYHQNSTYADDDYYDEQDDHSQAETRRAGHDVRVATRQEPTMSTTNDHRSDLTGGLRMGSVPADLARITTIHPRTYNDARSIGEAFREGTPVIMNVTEMADADAKRLVDFSAGLVFGLFGTIERVTAKVFLLSPANVTVTAEDKAKMAESGFFNQS
jgi:cell division inhibitor SepF